MMKMEAVIVKYDVKLTEHEEGSGCSTFRIVLCV
jgi:hypothetical protein